MRTLITADHNLRHIRVHGQAFLKALAHQHIGTLEIHADNLRFEVAALVDDGHCEGLVIDELVIHGVPTVLSKVQWMEQVPHGLYLHSPRIRIRSVQIQNVHNGIILAGQGQIIESGTVRHFSGDGFQVVADHCHIQQLTVQGSLSVFPYQQVHRDVGMLFDRHGNVLSHVTVQHISYRPTYHLWCEPPQGILAPDHSYYDCHITDVDLSAVHPEHAVRFGHAHHCSIRRITSQSRVGFGSRKDKRIGSHNHVTDCEVAGIDNEDGSIIQEDPRMEQEHTRISVAGRQLLIELEGLRHEVYIDAVGAPTIGVGHKLTKSENASGKIWLSSGERLDFRQAPLTNQHIQALLMDDLKRYEAKVHEAVLVPIEQRQFDALVIFCYNVGRTAFARSTLLKKLNAGLYAEVPTQIRRWRFGKVNGKRVEIEGLINRRERTIQHWEGSLYRPIRDDDDFVLSAPVTTQTNTTPTVDPQTEPVTLDTRIHRYVNVEGRTIPRAEWDAFIQNMDQRQRSQVEQDYRHFNNKPKWQSKILLTVASLMVSTLFTVFGVSPDTLSPEMKNIIIAGLVTVLGSLIGIFRNWFTTHILR